ncbi:MAG TPA: hypothetical protein PKY12_05685, partial [Catalimonadaceae bacterium]|nr:hypothetical protein [Catalimonadaceae bacterium]
MGLFGSAEAQSKKQSPIVKQLLGNSTTTNEAGSADPPTTPGDPTECAICGDPDNPNYAPFPHIKWSVAFNNKKSFFACDPRHWFG